jgi:beta-galactosidase
MFHNRRGKLLRSGAASEESIVSRTNATWLAGRRGVSASRKQVRSAALCAAWFSVAAGIAWSTPAPPRKAAPPAAPARHGRETVVIDDGWTFRADPSRTGEAQGWASAPAGGQPVAVPSLWPQGGAAPSPGAGWYWREIDPSRAWAGQTVRLRFEAVADHAEVWLNGQRLGEHRGGATPFELNITKALKIGAKNQLAVEVEGDIARGAGIWQGVLLMAHDEAYIADVFPYGGPLGNLRAEVELLNTSDKTGEVSLDARILAAEGKNAEIKKSGQNITLTPSRNMTTMLVNVPKKKLAAWSPETPSLFRFDLAFHQDKDVLDTTETTFGFRDLGWRDGSITINGVPITPRAVAPGIGRPVVIATEDDRTAARESLRKLKAAKVNILYLEAPPPALLSLADEEGLLIVEGARRNQSAADADRELIELVRRDRAHPAVLAWNAPHANETYVAAIRALDPTRFVLAGVGPNAKLYPPRSTDLPAAAPPAGLVLP